MKWTCGGCGRPADLLEWVRYVKGETHRFVDIRCDGCKKTQLIRVKRLPSEETADTLRDALEEMR